MIANIVAGIFVLLAAAMCVIVAVGKTPLSEPKHKMFYFMSTAVYLSGTLFVAVIVFLKGLKSIPFVVVSEVSILIVYVITLVVLTKMINPKE